MARLTLLAAAAAVVVLSSVIAGCTGDRPAAVAAPTTSSSRTTIAIPTTTLPHLTGSFGIAASIRQFREDEVAGVVQVQLVRGPDDADLVTVSSVRLDWPGFGPTAPTPRQVQLAPGQRVDIPTPLGDVVCASSTPPSYSLGEVEVVVDRDGAPVSVRAPLLADAQRALDNVWSKGCVRRRVLERVGIAYSSPWSRSDPDGVPTATTDLVITRVGTDDEIAVTGVDGSVLLFVNPAAPLPDTGSTLKPGADVTRTPIVATGAGRCDGHALGDSKKTYVFQIQVRIGGDEPVGIDLPVPEGDRGVLNQVIVDTCGADQIR